MDLARNARRTFPNLGKNCCSAGSSAAIVTELMRRKDAKRREKRVLINFILIFVVVGRKVVERERAVKWTCEFRCDVSCNWNYEHVNVKHLTEECRILALPQLRGLHLSQLRNIGRRTANESELLVSAALYRLVTVPSITAAQHRLILSVVDKSPPDIILVPGQEDQSRLACCSWVRTPFTVCRPARVKCDYAWVLTSSDAACWSCRIAAMWLGLNCDGLLRLPQVRRRSWGNHFLQQQHLMVEGT